MSVDRCICSRVTFATLIEMHEREGLSRDELCARTGCGTGCGMCLPYISIALRTKSPRVPLSASGTVNKTLKRVLNHTN